jgi:hypothetical protein
MGKHSLDTDFDRLPLGLALEVPTHHRAADEDVRTTPLVVPLLPYLPPVAAHLHVGVTEAPVPYAQTKAEPLSELVVLLGRGLVRGPRYRRTPAGAR